MMFTQPADASKRTALTDTLSKLTAAMKADGKQPSPEEAPATSPRKQLIAPMLTRVLSTVARYIERCHCLKPHKILLLLYTHRIASEKDSSIFRVLFSHATGATHWQETTIAIKEEMYVLMLEAKMLLTKQGQIHLFGLFYQVRRTDA